MRIAEVIEFAGAAFKRDWEEPSLRSE